MTEAIDIVLASPRWRKALPGVERLCRRMANATLATANAAGDIRIALAGDAMARDLNRRFRGIDKATNVLSFPAHGPDTRRDADGRGLGDVLIAFETTAREARAMGMPMEDHLAHLVVHGTLHLLGRDHERAADAEIMESIETELLARFGVADPYAASSVERPS